MKTKLIALIIFANVASLICGANVLSASDNCAEIVGNSTLGENNFLDVIIDESHAYVYLSCSDCNDGNAYSVYASLMPKDQEGGDELDRFPKIIQWLLREAPIAEHSNENGIYMVRFPNDTSMDLTDFSNLTTQSNGGFNVTFRNGTIISHGMDDEEGSGVREVIVAFGAAVFYTLSDYIGTAQKGEIINDLPKSDEIKIQKRFYLTPEQVRLVFELINKSFKDSLEGGVVYDSLKHNCIDYAKEIYEGAGLDKARGEFLSQFDLNPDFSIFDDKQTGHTILDKYREHNAGSLGFGTIFALIWKEAFKPEDTNDEE